MFPGQRFVACDREQSFVMPPDVRANKRKGKRPGWHGGLYDFMRRVWATERGSELYARRQTMIEPVFAHTKFNRRCDRFFTPRQIGLLVGVAPHRGDSQSPGMKLRGEGSGGGVRAR